MNHFLQYDEMFSRLRLGNMMEPDTLLATAIFIAVIFLFVLLFVWFRKMFGTEDAEHKRQQTEQNIALLNMLREKKDTPVTVPPKNTPPALLQWNAPVSGASCPKNCVAGVCQSKSGECSPEKCMTNECCCMDYQCAGGCVETPVGASDEKLKERFANVSGMAEMEQKMRRADVEYNISLEGESGDKVMKLELKSPKVIIERKEIVGTPSPMGIIDQNDEITKTNQEIKAINERINKYNQQNNNPISQSGNNRSPRMM